MKHNKLDAQMNEIVIGSRYGYALSNNGVNDIVHGVAEKFTPAGMITIKVEQRWSSYSNSVMESGDVLRRKVSVLPFKLFPVPALERDKAQELFEIMAPFVRTGFDKAITEIGEYIDQIEVIDKGDLYLKMTEMLCNKREVVGQDILNEIEEMKKEILSNHKA